MAKRFLHFLEKYSLSILGIAIICVFLWIISTFSYPATVAEDANQAVNDFNQNWIFTYQGTSETLGEIPVKMPVRRGSVYSIENTLPENIDQSMSLVLCTTRQTGTVSVNGQQIAELANESGRLFEELPISKVHYIPLKEAYAGQKIKIDLVSYSYEFSGRVNEMYYGEHGACIKTHLIFQAPLAALYLFLLFVGIALSAIYLFIKADKKKYLEILLLGFTTVNLVLVVTTENNMFQDYLSSDIRISVLGLISKLSLPFAYLTYFSVVSNIRRTKSAARYMMIFFSVLCLTILFARLNDFVDLAACMAFYTVSTVVMYAVTVILTIVEICVEYLYSRIPLFLALHIFMLTIIIEGFSYFQYVVSYRNFGVFLGAGAACSLAILGVVFTNNIIHAFEENRRINEELLRNRIDLMINQIQPHFIYNTLNSIQSLIETEPVRASEMIYNFSKYLRTHVDTMEAEGLVMFAEELDNIKAYADIELVRFRKIKVVYDIQEKRFFVPMLSIQPIVENAIRHGVSKKLAGGTIEIKSYKTERAYMIEINDDGVGFPMSDKSKEQYAGGKYSVGVKNITYRLNQLINATVKWESEVGKGTRVQIHIPKKEGGFDENDYS